MLHHADNQWAATPKRVTEKAAEKRLSSFKAPLKGFCVYFSPYEFSYFSTNFHKNGPQNGPHFGYGG